MGQAGPGTLPQACHGPQTQGPSAPLTECVSTQNAFKEGAVAGGRHDKAGAGWPGRDETHPCFFFIFFADCWSLSLHRSTRHPNEVKAPQTHTTTRSTSTTKRSCVWWLRYSPNSQCTSSLCTLPYTEKKKNKSFHASDPCPSRLPPSTPTDPLLRRHPIKNNGAGVSDAARMGYPEPGRQEHAAGFTGRA